jgi:type VI protein secretion system component VasK
LRQLFDDLILLFRKAHDVTFVHDLDDPDRRRLADGDFLQNTQLVIVLVRVTIQIFQTNVDQIKNKQQKPNHFDQR